MNNIAVVIPCYNEETTIKQVIFDYKQYFDDIYVIDNNCTDNTAKIALENGAKVIKETTQGKGAALRKAFNEIDADIIILTDGDCTYSAYDSNNLVIYLQQNKQYNMIVGNRLNCGYFSYNQKIHGIGNRLFSKIATYKLKKPVYDLLSGSRVLTKKFYKNIKIVKNGFEVETELTKKCNNFTYLDIGYTKRPYNSKSSLHTIKDGIKILRTLL